MSVRTRGLRRALGAWLIGALAAAVPAEANPGDIDRTFGTDGLVVTDFGGDDSAADVAIQANGKIVAVGGYYSGDFTIARYNPDGSLDPTFDGDGMATTGFGADEGATSVAIQPDGKIVAAGGTTAGPNDPNFALARYSTDGSLDFSFDGDGLLFTDFGDDEVATDVALAPDGKIVAVGSTISGAGAANFAFARYNANGSPDNSFDADGLRTVEFGGLDAADAVAIQADGSVLGTGFTTTNGEWDIALVRLTPGGTPDPGFGAVGRVITDLGDTDGAQAMAIQPDQRILVSGAATPSGGMTDTAVVRYLPSGERDPSFGTGGAVTLVSDGASDSSKALVLQPDGKIVVQTGASFNVARFAADGSIDTGFGQDGLAVVNAGASSTGAALAIQPDGSIIEAGVTKAGPNPDNFGLMRLAGGEPPVGPDLPPRPTCRGRTANVVALAGVPTKGTPFDDVIVGTAGRDRIKASGGNDLVCALGGRNRVAAGPGADTVIGGTRRDVFKGGGGADVLRGKRANDRLRGNGGADLLVGGKGRADRCVGGAGHDRTRSCAAGH